MMALVRIAADVDHLEARLSILAASAQRATASGRSREGGRYINQPQSDSQSMTESAYLVAISVRNKTNHRRQNAMVPKTNDR